MMSRRMLLVALAFVCATSVTGAVAGSIVTYCPQASHPCDLVYTPDQAIHEYQAAHCDQLPPFSSEGMECEKQADAAGTAWVKMITEKCHQCCSLVGKMLHPFADCSMFAGTMPGIQSTEVIAAPTPSPGECYTACAKTFSECTQECKPGDATCYTQCTSTYQQTCLPTCGLPTLSLALSPAPVMGARECVKECKNKGKDAANKCKHEKFALRAQCYAQVPNVVKACESSCTRKPHDDVAVDAQLQ